MRAGLTAPAAIVVLVGVLLLLGTTFYKGSDPRQELAVEEKTVWAVLLCASRRAGKPDLEYSRPLGGVAEELAEVYRERGQREALRRAQDRGYTADFRVITQRGDELGRAERNPCSVPWFAAIPGSPGLAPRDDLAIREAGLAVEGIIFRGEKALLVVLVWKGEGTP